MASVPGPVANPFEHEEELPQSTTSCCNCTASKVAKVSAFIFIVCALVVATAALCMHYPSAPAVAYSFFGAIGTFALITMAITAIKSCLSSQSASV